MIQGQASLQGDLGDAAKGLQGGVVAGDPIGLNISRGQRLRGLVGFAGVGDGDFFQPDSALVEQLARHRNDFLGIRFRAVVKRSHDLHAGHDLLDGLDGVFDGRKRAHTGNVGPMVFHRLSRPRGDGVIHIHYMKTTGFFRTALQAAVRQGVVIATIKSTSELSKFCMMGVMLGISPLA